MNGECDDCGGFPALEDAERWLPAGEGECVGCNRRVKNLWMRRGDHRAACLRCLWARFNKVKP